MFCTGVKCSDDKIIWISNIYFRVCRKMKAEFRSLPYLPLSLSGWFSLNYWFWWECTFQSGPILPHTVDYHRQGSFWPRTNYISGVQEESEYWSNENNVVMGYLGWLNMNPHESWFALIGLLKGYGSGSFVLYLKHCREALKVTQRWLHTCHPNGEFWQPVSDGAYCKPCLNVPAILLPTSIWNTWQCLRVSSIWIVIHSNLRREDLSLKFLRERIFLCWIWYALGLQSAIFDWLCRVWIATFSISGYSGGRTNVSEFCIFNTKESIINLFLVCLLELLPTGFGS